MKLSPHLRAMRGVHDSTIHPATRLHIRACEADAWQHGHASQPGEVLPPRGLTLVSLALLGAAPEARQRINHGGGGAGTGSCGGGAGPGDCCGGAGPGDSGAAVQELAAAQGLGGGAGPGPSSGDMHVHSTGGSPGHAEKASAALSEQRRQRAGCDLPVSGLWSLLASIAWHGVRRD